MVRILREHLLPLLKVGEEVPLDPELALTSPSPERGGEDGGGTPARAVFRDMKKWLPQVLTPDL